jgi:uncharacterized protein (UPF0333 family)
MEIVILECIVALLILINVRQYIVIRDLTKITTDSVNAHNNLVNALKEAAEVERLKRITNYSNQIGEA